MLDKSQGYYLSSIPSKDALGTYCIEVLKTGNWDCGDQGILDVTSKDLEEIADNFNQKSYWPVAVDGPTPRPGMETGQAHAKSDAYDCGQVRELILSDDKAHLFARFGLTNAAVHQMVDEGSLTHCSAELNFGYKDPASRQRLKVLTGLGLTNRPLIKGMSPAERSSTINLSEYFGKETNMNEAEINALKQKASEADQLRAELIALKEKDQEGLSLSEQLDTAKKLAEEANKKSLELSEKLALSEKAAAKVKRTAFLDSFEQVLKEAMVTRGALTPASAMLLAELAETIYDAGIRTVQLSEAPQNGDTSTIYRAGQDGIIKADLIDMLTAVINSLPGDIVHVQPTGKQSADAELDEDGQLDVDGNDKGQMGDENPMEGKKSLSEVQYRLSDRFKPVVNKEAAGKGAEYYLNEVSKHMKRHPGDSPADVLKELMQKDKIKNLSEVK